MMKRNLYIDTSGRTWNSYQDYCNSNELDHDIICVMLETGRRTPQNDWEREYVKNTEMYKDKGVPTELPFD